jgi:hypothetical protein
VRPRFHPTPGVAFQIGRPRPRVPMGWIWGFLALVSWGLLLAVLISIPG